MGELFQAPGQFTPFQHYPVTTTQALQADISAQTDNFPIIAPARMRFAQPDQVI